MRLLVLEDEAEIAFLLRRLLQRENYVVDVADSIATAKEAVLGVKYDLIILDRRLPDGDGVNLVSFTKEKSIQTRYLILSALGDTLDRVAGLDGGADDYLVKPFEPDELFARVRALLRRPLPEAEQIWRCGQIEYDQNARTVTIAAESVVFSRRELPILECLIVSAGRVVTRDMIESAAYGYDDDIQSNTLESHVSRIRKLLAQHDANVSIHAVRGIGYMMKEQKS